MGGEVEAFRSGTDTRTSIHSFIASLPETITVLSCGKVQILILKNQETDLNICENLRSRWCKVTHQCHLGHVKVIAALDLLFSC